MYLTNLTANDPTIFEQTIKLHQSGKLPPNTWIINLDTIVENARKLSKKAKQLELKTYLMSKQHNRNPYINHLAQANGLGKIVAVDATCALMARRYQIPVGHVGHLNQIPRHLLPLILSLKPEIITVYSNEQVEWIDQAAKDLGIIQEVMLRVYKEGDIFFEGQEGGVHLDELKPIVKHVNSYQNVRLTGVTAFPCIQYNETYTNRIETTPNLQTIQMAVERLRSLGCDITQVNTPGNTACETMETLKKNGATHVEPGNGLLGTTPNHAFKADMEEQTAFIYLTEVSHFFENRTYAFGGGVYHTAYADEIYALVGDNWMEAQNNRVKYHQDVRQDIDYHMQLLPTKSQRCKIGDSVLFAYRTQMHMTRSYVAPISGLSGKVPLKVHYLFDNANNPLNDQFQPVDPGYVIEDIKNLLKQY